MAEAAIEKRLKALIAFRVFLVTALLGTFFIFQIGYEYFPFPSVVLYLIVILYTCSIIYSLALGKVPNLPHAYTQFTIDVVAVTALIFLTGGIESWFSSFMIIIIIAAAIIIGKRAGYFIAVFASILYGVLVDLQYYDMLPLPHNPLLTERDFFYNIFSHMLAMYVTAYLIGYLVRTLEEKGVDLQDLTLFNREVIENTPSGLLTTDTAGRVLVFNRAAEEITGLSRSEAKGRNADRIFPFLRDLNNTQRLEGNIVKGEQIKTVGLTTSPMLDTKGRKTGYIGIFQDLTEFKKLGEEVRLKEKLAAAGELAANIAHEIRNPLASLKGSIEILREGNVPEEKMERLMSIALGEMDRLNIIIKDFLVYTRPRSITSEAFDLHEMLDKTITLIEGSRKSDVTVLREYVGQMQVNADRLQLEQVFLNIGLNALEAMPEGGELKVRTSSDDGTVDVTISDTGRGITPEERDKVFYPFFTTKESGTGLGLSIAHRIVSDHGGTITVSDSSEKGTEFTVRLPLEYERP